MITKKDLPHQVWPTGRFTATISDMNVTLDLKRYVPKEGERWVLISLKDDEELIVIPGEAKQKVCLNDIPFPVADSQPLAAIRLATEQYTRKQDDVIDLRVLNERE